MDQYLTYEGTYEGIYFFLKGNALTLKKYDLEVTIVIPDDINNVITAIAWMCGCFASTKYSYVRKEYNPVVLTMEQQEKRLKAFWDQIKNEPEPKDSFHPGSYQKITDAYTVLIKIFMEY